jgi:hypothetical protein
MLRPLTLGLCTTLALTVLAGPASAAPTSRAACFSAYERVQVGMRRGHLLDARAAASECLSDACPGPLRADCGQWLREVEARLPSIVVEVRTSDGKPAEGARLLLDGAPWKDRPDGLATELDPGEHVVRAEPGGDGAAAETRVVVDEGRKAQRVVVELAAPPAPPPPVVAPSPVETPRAPPERAPVPTAAIVLGGAGVLALGGFTFFAITGKNAEHGLEACSPRCSDDAVAPVRQRYLAADVFLGVSVIALGVAAYLYLARGYEGRAPSE